MAFTTSFVIPEKIRKVMLGMPLERLLRSHSHFLGYRLSEDSGDESDFREYLNYVPGEDPKRIDWKVYARSDTQVVKRFSSEKSRNIYLILDCSASMADEGCHHFLETFYYLVVYLSLKNEDFEVICINEKETRWVKKGSGINHIRKVEETLSNLSFIGTSHLTEPFLKAVTPFEKNSEVIYFSDFQTSIVEMNRIIDVMHYQKIHLTLVGAFNRRAYELPESLGSRGGWLKDQENGLRKFISHRHIKEYQHQVAYHYHQLKELAWKRNIRYIQIDSQQDSLEGFLELF